MVVTLFTSGSWLPSLLSEVLSIGVNTIDSSLSLSLSPGPWWRVVALHRALVPPPLLQLNKQGNIHPNSCSIYTHPATITKAKWLMR